MSADTVATQPEDQSKSKVVQASSAVGTATVTATFMSPKELAFVHSSLAKAKGQNAPPSSSVAPAEMKRRLAMVEEFIRLCNAGDWQGSGATTFETDAELYFTDQHKNVDVRIPWRMWVEENYKVAASFPDFHFTCHEWVTTDCGVIVVHAQASGTHTGAPYACGPCEPIDAAGSKVCNDPEEFCFFFREGQEKCCRMVVCAKGEMTGPPGLYTQIGGFPAL